LVGKTFGVVKSLVRKCNSLKNPLPFTTVVQTHESYSFLPSFIFTVPAGGMEVLLKTLFVIELLCGLKDSYMYNSTAVSMACCTPSFNRELHSAYDTPRDAARARPSLFVTIRLSSEALLLLKRKKIRNLIAISLPS